MISTDDEWRIHANCINREDLFNLEFPPEIEGTPGVVDPGYREWVAEHREKFARAEEICLECPVFVQCGKAASDEDKEWTVRAGEKPALFEDMARFPAYMCNKPLHVERRAEGSLHCPDCKQRERYNAKRRERRRDPEYKAAKRLFNQEQIEKRAEYMKRYRKENNERIAQKRREYRENLRQSVVH